MLDTLGIEEGAHGTSSRQSLDPRLRHATQALCAFGQLVEGSKARRGRVGGGRYRGKDAKDVLVLGGVDLFQDGFQIGPVGSLAERRRIGRDQLQLLHGLAIGLEGLGSTRLELPGLGPGVQILPERLLQAAPLREQRAHPLVCVLLILEGAHDEGQPDRATRGRQRAAAAAAASRILLGGSQKNVIDDLKDAIPHLRI